MGNYKEVKGDLLKMAKEGKFDLIAHGANCFQVMGAGIAAGVAKVFPDAYRADLADTRDQLQRLGDLTYVMDTESNTLIVNLYTQYQGGPNLDYIALELSLQKMVKRFSSKYYKTIGLPLIGCGIAGGDWKKVKKIIKRVLSDYNVTVVIYDK